MLAELILLFSFMGSGNFANPYWINDEVVSFRYTAIASSGFTDYDDGAYDESQRPYFITIDCTYEFDLVSNSASDWQLRLSEITCISRLYVDFYDDGQIQADIYTSTATFQNNPVNAYSPNDIANFYVVADLDQEYSSFSVTFFGLNNEVLFLSNAGDFDSHIFNTYDFFSSEFRYDVRNLNQQIEEHLNAKYDPSYQQGYDQGYQYGLSVGETNGYQSGYNDGFADADNLDDTALTIFTGIINVALVPINMFLGMLNFEVFGINIGGFVSSLLTIAIVVIIMRIVVSGGNKND